MQYVFITTAAICSVILSVKITAFLLQLLCMIPIHLPIIGLIISLLGIYLPGKMKKWEDDV